MATLPITTAAVPNPAVQEIDRIAAQLSDEISAQQQAVVPATPTIPTPDDVPDNAISVVSGVMASSVSPGDAPLATIRPELAAAIERDQKVSGQITADLQATLDLAPVQAGILSDAILVGAAADKVIALQTDKVNRQAQNATIQANRAAGGVERQTALMTDLKDQGKVIIEKLTEKADIVDDEHTGIQLIDNVINTFRSLQVDMEILAEKDVQQEIQSQIQAITTSTQAVATGTQLTKETINKSTIAANQDKLTATANIEQVKAQISMVQSNAQVMGSLLSASRSQVENLVSIAQLQNTEENQVLARERLNITRQQMEEQRLLNEQRFRQGEVTIARTSLALAQEQNLAPTEIAFRRQQLQNAIITGEGQRLALAENVATSDARVSEILTRSDTAKVALQQAEANLDQFLGTDEDVRAKLALAAQTAQVTFDAVTFELAEAQKNAPIIEAQRNINLLTSNQQLQQVQRVNRAGAATEAGTIAATIAENEQQVKSARDTEEYYDFIVPMVQKAQAMLYGEGNNVEPRGVIVAGISPGATQTQREKYESLADIGVTNQIGDKPFDAAVNLAQAAPSGNIPRGRTTALITDIQNEQNQKYADDPAKVPNTPQEQAADFNATALEVMKTHGRNIKSGDVTNPFHAPPLSALEIGFSALQKDPLYSKVLKPAGITESNPDKIMEQAIAGIRSGTISAEQAVDGLTLIYESAISYNNAFEGGFQRVGLPNQGSYLTALPNPDAQGFFGSLITDVNTIATDIKENPFAIGGTSFAAGVILPAAGLTAPISLPVAGVLALGTTIASQFLPTRSDEARINMADFNEVKAYITARMNSLPLEANKSTGE